MAAADYPREAVTSNSDAGAMLHRHLDRLATRRNTLLLWQEITRALCWGAAVAALMVLAYKFYLVDGVWWQPALVVLFSGLIGWRSGVLRRASTFDAALDADQTLNLKDRLASALAFTHPNEVTRRRESAPLKSPLARLRAFAMPRPVYAESVRTASTSLVPALINDAASRAGQLDPRQVYPLRFGRPQKMLSASALALCGICLLPNLPYFLSKDQKTDVKTTLPETGKKLTAIAKEVRNNKDLKDNDEAKKLAKKLAALGQKMQRARMGRKAALVEMAQLREKISKEAQKAPPQPFNAQLEQPQDGLAKEPMQTEEGRKMREHLKKGEMEKAAQEMQKLADKIEKNDLTKEERDKAAHDLEKAAQALRRQGGEQNQQMAQKLEEAAKALKQQNQQNQAKGDQNKQNGQQNQPNQAGQQQGNKQGQQQGQQAGQKQGQQGGQKQGQQQGQQPGIKSQLGQKQGQQQQGQQPGQQQSGQQGQKSGQQGGQQQSGQQPGQQSGQQPGQQGGGQQSLSNGADALRQMAQGMQSGQGQGQGQSGANSEALQRMLSQIRDAECQAGSGGACNNPGQSPGSGKSGFGGNGQGQPSLTPGKDLKPSDPHSAVGGGPGLGPRNNVKGYNNQGGGLSNQKAKRTGDKRRWGDVWAPKLPGTRKKIDRITGNLSKGEVEQLQIEGNAKGGPVKTPYYDVYETYKKEADDAVGKEVVPPAYKQPVKDYFDSLKPSN